ncbi:sodium:proton antiporter [Virgibacillus halodenitrificans]|uniref:cation:proton antiporter n=1 Tax=Virgibacillus halodenitrificans TaxID=1482 RepID=UPI00137110C2|nr:cation:proton antiporter [Virgibacillus halodenitrificans]MYL44059.1 sodium:proton antiporter [Virgibacillus halodenitrificans]MYL57288.1 sodium:proton antiporter [Virgibacillus halodenitrificans]
MQDLDLHHVFELGLIMIMIAAGITAIAKKFKKPYPIALVIVGAFIGLSDITVLKPLKDFITEGEVFNFVIITLFLPALLGEAALKLPFSHLNENKAPILTLAFGGTFLSFLIIGFLSMGLLDFPIAAAFVFAAIMSATDPVSVLSIFKGLGVNKKLATIIEGESLFNDGLAVVLFNISAFSLITYLDLGLEGAGLGVWEFIKVISLGLIIGGALGFGFSRLTRYFDDYPLEIIFSIILFYGAFLLAECFHASGVIAVVVAALVFGNYGGKIGMSPTTKLNINNFWDVTALLANSLVFLMVGLEITRIDVHDKWGLIFLAILIVFIARSLAVYTSLLFIKNIPTSWKHIFNWGGLKGSLSIALVLSLPRDFPGREDILIVAFSVVLFSLVIQGLTIKGLLSWLGISLKREGHEEYEEIIAHSHQYEAAIQEINKVKKNLFIAEPVSAEIVQAYKEKLDKLHEEMQRLLEKYPNLKQEQQIVLRKYALYAQHEAVELLETNDVISNEIAEKEKEAVTEKLVELEEED